MKTASAILLAGLLVGGCLQKHTVSQKDSVPTGQDVNLKLVDDKLAAKAEIVLRSRLLAVDMVGKHAQFRVQVLQIVKNEPRVKLIDELLVDSSGSQGGVPIGGKFTIYLDRHDKTNTALWMLVGASHNTE
jgi:hypothetical protein